MKALTIASLTALAFAGAACSETSPAEPDVTVTEVAEAAPVDDGFNLMIPGDTSGSAVADDGFNLGLPDSGGTVASDGFNLPANVSTGSGLDDVPEIDTSILQDEAPAATPDEDEIIRLDP